MNGIGKIFFVVSALFLTVPAVAVTDKEMEEAKTITAKAYLRYANNGSGYLDDVSVKTMTELTSKLKAKEKENLKAFNSVAVPKDYAKWDKEKLVEFWSVTFFTSPALDANGKAAKTRVRKQISAMNISAPAADAPKEEAKPVVAEQPAEPVAESPVEVQGAEQPDAEAAVAEQENILNDQQAIQKDAEEAAESSMHQEQSHTWVYILVLAILVGLIIWLVVYAANLMKRQPGAGDEDADVDNEKLRDQTRKAIAKKNEELAQVQERLRAEESKSAELGMEIERLKRDLRRQDEELSQLREENRRLNAAAAGATARREPAPEPARQPRREPARREPEPERSAVAAPKPEPEQKPILKVIYLGRANGRGIFVRADRRINPGNTIYRLDTNDGLVGTFHVVDEPEVVDVALSDPSEYLANGCTGEDLEDTAGVTRIITESAGTAIFENNYWKIIRKSRIRYE